METSLLRTPERSDETASRAAANSRCPRCGGEFRCGVDDTTPCACTTIRLEAALLAQLRSRYGSCLCMGCLSELAG